MKNSKVLKVILFISGFIAIGIGATILTMPVAFYATSGINLHGNVSLLNEVRASGGALLACGILITLGAFIARLTFTSVVISSLLYLSYGLSRMMSVVIDGMPVDSLIQALVLELVIGLVCIVALMRFSIKDGRAA